MHNISPFLRSPLTDITGGIISHQLLGRCQKEEMQLMDCLEAYGLDRGIKLCNYLIDDYRECHTLAKQFKRFYVMRSHLEKKIANGELTREQAYVTPRIDSY